MFPALSLTSSRVLSRLLIVAALLSAALAPLAAVSPAASGAAGDREARLRIATYNIHAGIGSDGDFDLSRTAAAIRDSGANVVALQEVDVHWGARSDWRDEARALSRMLGMRVFFAPIYQLDPPIAGEPPREYGLAILSRYPIMHADNHEIARLSSQSPDPGPKPMPGFPEVVLNVHGVRVHVYDTHLDYRGDPTVREMQVEDMLAIMAEDRGHPQILLGDFNAPPDAPELKPLWDHVVDTWEVAQQAGEGLTFPAADPVKRIDYITVSPGIDVAAVRVPRTTASDHLPVVADLIIPAG